MCAVVCVWCVVFFRVYMWCFVYMWCCVCVWCGVVCGEAWHAKKTSVCRFKTSPCVPAPRAHVLPHAGVVPVHTGRFESTHGGFLDGHTEERVNGGRGEGGHRQFC